MTEVSLNQRKTPLRAVGFVFLELQIIFSVE